VVEVEFTIEPFVEGQPGAHVTAAIAADQNVGAVVEVGPFGSSCRLDDDAAAAVVAAITDAAMANGASHVSIHVGRLT
jgi:uncharacterized protein YqgV (UPF0045/DUF77 family)